MRLLRLAIIFFVVLKYGLDEFLTGHERFLAARLMARALTFWRDTSAPLAVRLRLALEDSGPIFVKFGQMLSSAPTCFRPRSRGSSPSSRTECRHFVRTQAPRGPRPPRPQAVGAGVQGSSNAPVASASVAQVHFAALPDGRPVAVKVLRPNVAR